MTTISDLLLDLVGEILSRLPITFLGAVRSTCKQWNVLSKDQSFTKKHCAKAGKEFLVNITWNDCGWDNSTRTILNLHGIDNIKSLPSIKKTCTTLCPAQIFEIYPCDGLLLCVAMTKKSRLVLVVWNLYTSRTRLIKTRNILEGGYKYALGYDNNNNYKVLRFFYVSREIAKADIYEFQSNLWRVLDVDSNYYLSRDCYKGVSLKGNTYFVEKESVICFDFTAERFGPRTNLPFHSVDVVPSCVIDEQLAVLYQKYAHSYELEIWITTNIEPNTVSWSKFFKVDMDILAGVDFLSKFRAHSFFIDKEKKLALVHGKYRDTRYRPISTSYVVGGDGYNKRTFRLKQYVFSYVPSSTFI